MHFIGSVSVIRGGSTVDGTYEGEWTLLCDVKHVHTNKCRPIKMEGFGRLTYQLNGEQVKEKGENKRGRKEREGME